MKILFCFVLLMTNAYSAEIKDFKLPIFGESKSLNLSSLVKKQKVVLNFWASWCTACIKELDELEELKKKNPKVLFLAINGGDSKKKIKRFLKKHKFSYVVLEDKNVVYSKSVGVLALPQTFVIGKGMKILYRGNRPPKEL